jgi:hypothetical protein
MRDEGSEVCQPFVSHSVLSLILHLLSFISYPSSLILHLSKEAIMPKNVIVYHSPG